MPENPVKEKGNEVKLEPANFDWKTGRYNWKGIDNKTQNLERIYHELDSRIDNIRKKTMIVANFQEVLENDDKFAAHNIHMIRLARERKVLELLRADYEEFVRTKEERLREIAEYDPNLAQEIRDIKMPDNAKIQFLFSWYKAIRNKEPDKLKMFAEKYDMIITSLKKYEEDKLAQALIDKRRILLSIEKQHLDTIKGQLGQYRDGIVNLTQFIRVVEQYIQYLKAENDDILLRKLNESRLIKHLLHYLEEIRYLQQILYNIENDDANWTFFRMKFFKHLELYAEKMKKDFADYDKAQKMLGMRKLGEDREKIRQIVSVWIRVMSNRKAVIGEEEQSISEFDNIINSREHELEQEKMSSLDWIIARFRKAAIAAGREELESVRRVNSLLARKHDKIRKERALIRKLIVRFNTKFNINSYHLARMREKLQDRLALIDPETNTSMTIEEAQQAYIHSIAKSSAAVRRMEHESGRLLPDSLDTASVSAGIPLLLAQSIIVDHETDKRKTISRASQQFDQRAVPIIKFCFGIVIQNEHMINQMINRLMAYEKHNFQPVEGQPKISGLTTPLNPEYQDLAAEEPENQGDTNA